MQQDLISYGLLEIPVLTLEVYDFIGIGLANHPRHRYAGRPEPNNHTAEVAGLVINASTASSPFFLSATSMFQFDTI